MNILDQEKVENIDVGKVRAAFVLLEASGLSKDTLQSIRYELAVDECTHCGKSWPAKDSPVVRLPPWRFHHRRKDIRPNGWYPDVRRVKLALCPPDGAEHTPPVRWEMMRACKTCTLQAASEMGKYIAHHFPRKTLNAFLRILHYTINRQRTENKPDWKEDRQYDGYVAITNALMQNIQPKGNKVAVTALVKISTSLGLL